MLLIPFSSLVDVLHAGTYMVGRPFCNTKLICEKYTFLNTGFWKTM